MRVVDYHVPTQDGGLLADPPVRDWPAIVSALGETGASWDLEVLGAPAGPLRAEARAAALAEARAYTRSVDPGCDRAADPSAPLIVTGHQPALFHPGVWIKNMLVSDLARGVAGVGLNLVVDSDAIGAVCLNYPLDRGDGAAAVDYSCLFEGPQDTPFEALLVPDAARLDAWLAPVRAGLVTLGDPGIAGRFEKWADACSAALGRSRDFADLMVATRRATEGPLGLEYLELPVSRLASGDAFLKFALDLCARAGRFRQSYNAALEQYRRLRDIRNPANPFPDLGSDGDFIEMPFWIVTGDGRRESLWSAHRGDSLVLNCGSCVAVTVPADDAGAALKAVRDEGVTLRPKAVTLTMFTRVFLADFFVHGVGGGKYDAVTDEVIAAMYGLRPPAYAVASMTMVLPLAGPGSTDAPETPPESLARLERRLSVLKHNPDRLLSEVGSIDAEVDEVAARKRELVAAIALEGADKKAIGAEIRDLNERLQAHVAPMIQATEAEIARLRERVRAAEVASYRDFAYCFFDPAYVRQTLDKALAAEPAAGSPDRGVEEGAS